MAKSCRHLSHRMTNEKPTSNVGDVWRAFMCNACGEVGVLRSGSTVINWEGLKAPVDKASELRAYLAPFTSRCGKR